MTTVKELKEILNGLPEDMPILMACDSEGNGYSALSGHCGGNHIWIEEDQQLYCLTDSADDNCMDEDEWAEIKANNPIVLTLWP